MEYKLSLNKGLIITLPINWKDLKTIQCSRCVWNRPQMQEQMQFAEGFATSSGATPGAKNLNHFKYLKPIC